MKKEIHPKYYENIEVKCICGNTFTVNATIPGPIKIESCIACNKSETKVIKGRMEKYLERQKKTKSIQDNK